MTMKVLVALVRQAEQNLWILHNCVRRAMALLQYGSLQAVSVRVRAHTRTRAGAAHSVRSACVDLVPAVRAMCV